MNLKEIENSIITLSKAEQMCLVEKIVRYWRRSEQTEEGAIEQLVLSMGAEYDFLCELQKIKSEFSIV